MSENLILCVLKNPHDNGDRVWLYNTFFKNNRRTLKFKNLRAKVHHLITATQEEIEQLKERNVLVYQIAENIDIDLEDDVTKLLKQSFSILYSLMNKLLELRNPRNAIKALLSDEDYKILDETNKLLREKT